MAFRVFVYFVIFGINFLLISAVPLSALPKNQRFSEFDNSNQYTREIPQDIYAGESNRPESHIDWINSQRFSDNDFDNDKELNSDIFWNLPKSHGVTRHNVGSNPNSEALNSDIFWGLPKSFGDEEDFSRDSSVNSDINNDILWKTSRGRNLGDFDWNVPTLDDNSDFGVYKSPKSKTDWNILQLFDGRGRGKNENPSNNIFGTTFEILDDVNQQPKELNRGNIILFFVEGKGTQPIQKNSIKNIRPKDRNNKFGWDAFLAYFDTNPGNDLKIYDNLKSDDPHISKPVWNDHRPCHCNKIHTNRDKNNAIDSDIIKLFGGSSIGKDGDLKNTNNWENIQSNGNRDLYIYVDPSNKYNLGDFKSQNDNFDEHDLNLYNLNDPSSKNDWNFLKFYNQNTQIPDKHSKANRLDRKLNPKSGARNENPNDLRNSDFEWNDLDDTYNINDRDPLEDYNRNNFGNNANLNKFNIYAPQHSNDKTFGYNGQINNMDWDNTNDRDILGLHDESEIGKDEDTSMNIDWHDLEDTRDNLDWDGLYWDNPNLDKESRLENYKDPRNSDMGGPQINGQNKFNVHGGRIKMPNRDSVDLFNDEMQMPNEFDKEYMMYLLDNRKDANPRDYITNSDRDIFGMYGGKDFNNDEYPSMNTYWNDPEDTNGNFDWDALDWDNPNLDKRSRLENNKDLRNSDMYAPQIYAQNKINIGGGRKKKPNRNSFNTFSDKMQMPNDFDEENVMYLFDNRKGASPKDYITNSDRDVFDRYDGSDFNNDEYPSMNIYWNERENTNDNFDWDALDWDNPILDKENRLENYKDPRNSDMGGPQINGQNQFNVRGDRKKTPNRDSVDIFNDEMQMPNDFDKEYMMYLLDNRKGIYPEDYITNSDRDIFDLDDGSDFNNGENPSMNIYWNDLENTNDNFDWDALDWDNPNLDKGSRLEKYQDPRNFGMGGPQIYGKNKFNVRGGRKRKPNRDSIQLFNDEMQMPNDFDKEYVMYLLEDRKGANPKDYITNSDRDIFDLYDGSGDNGEHPSMNINWNDLEDSNDNFDRDALDWDNLNLEKGSRLKTYKDPTNSDIDAPQIYAQNKFNIRGDRKRKPNRDSIQFFNDEMQMPIDFDKEYMMYLLDNREGIYPEDYITNSDRDIFDLHDDIDFNNGEHPSMNIYWNDLEDTNDNFDWDALDWDNSNIAKGSHLKNYKDPTNSDMDNPQIYAQNKFNIRGDRKRKPNRNSIQFFNGKTQMPNDFDKEYVMYLLENKKDAHPKDYITSNSRDVFGLYEDNDFNNDEDLNMDIYWNAPNDINDNFDWDALDMNDLEDLSNFDGDLSELPNKKQVGIDQDFNDIDTDASELYDDVTFGTNKGINNNIDWNRKYQYGKSNFPKYKDPRHSNWEVFRLNDNNDDTDEYYKNALKFYLSKNKNLNSKNFWDFIRFLNRNNISPNNKANIVFRKDGSLRNQVRKGSPESRLDRDGIVYYYDNNPFNDRGLKKIDWNALLHYKSSNLGKSQDPFTIDWDALMDYNDGTLAKDEDLSNLDLTAKVTDDGSIIDWDAEKDFNLDFNALKFHESSDISNEGNLKSSIDWDSLLHDSSIPEMKIDSSSSIDWNNGKIQINKNVDTRFPGKVGSNKDIENSVKVGGIIDKDTSLFIDNKQTGKNENLHTEMSNDMGLMIADAVEDLDTFSKVDEGHDDNIENIEKENTLIKHNSDVISIDKNDHHTLMDDDIDSEWIATLKLRKKDDSGGKDSSDLESSHEINIADGIKKVSKIIAAFEEKEAKNHHNGDTPFEISVPNAGSFKNKVNHFERKDNLDNHDALNVYIENHEDNYKAKIKDSRTNNGINEDIDDKTNAKKGNKDIGEEIKNDNDLEPNKNKNNNKKSKESKPGILSTIYHALFH